MHNFSKNIYFRKIRSCFLILLASPLYWFSFFVPRSKNIWVFGAWFGRRYADNSRHVYEYVCEKKKGVRAIWLSRDRNVVNSLRKSGRSAYLICSFGGFWFSCRASVVISSNGKMDVNRPAISRAIKIQLWHGIPLKRIDRLDVPALNSYGGLCDRIFALVRDALICIKKVMFPYLFEDWDYITSTSPLISARMASAYSVPESRVVITGYPRNDMLFDSRSRISVSLKDMIDAHSKLVLYAPTFRNKHDDNIDLFNGFDAKDMESCLKKHDVLLMIKMHPIIDASAIDMKKYEVPNVYWVKEKDMLELNELLAHVDLLITDYSGAYLDYLMLNRPIIFAPFDLARYVTNDRALYEDYEEVTPGVKCKNWIEVVGSMDAILSGQDDYLSARAAALAKYHTFRDDKSSCRVCRFVESLL